MLDAPRGFEPRSSDSKSDILPLDDGATFCLPMHPSQRHIVCNVLGGRPSFTGCMWKQNFFYFQSIIAYARTIAKFSMSVGDWCDRFVPVNFNISIADTEVNIFFWWCQMDSNHLFGLMRPKSAPCGVTILEVWVRIELTTFVPGICNPAPYHSSTTPY